MIIWCASYPKIGNTWVRAIITSFEILKKNEEREGFEEVANSNIKFFNLGQKQLEKFTE
jgi:hypothetical protein